MMRFTSKHQAGVVRSGFTLIEVVLAVGLSVILLGLLTMAIDLHLIRVDASRSTVEQATLVRGVFRIVADDFRQAAIGSIQDTAEASELAEASAAFDVDSIDQADPAATTDPLEAEAVVRPGFGMMGDAVSVMAYLERERPSPITPQTLSPMAQQAPPPMAGLTLVRYALADGSQMGGDGQPLRGLVRQEVNRDVYLYQQQLGGDAFAYGTTWSVAPEVVGMSIAYTDGTTTYTQWGTTEGQAPLPVAIELNLAVRTDGLHAAQAGDPAAAADIRNYRMVIALPAGFVAPVEEAVDPAATTSGATGSGV
ncbi:hypothetical protein Pla175_33800 [Pirellulimonas nuda]|uniref:Pseudopilin GspJ n=1 Tax=Pirellulimonas nuda TaxID=2528009 RepID=A0A518DET0_9BACT|nr:hypothetical protein [Pirellulimonas nuda]QDU89981.1 hypothetical protein Pla175_33800 [Pirellulimonas nuda]